MVTDHLGSLLTSEDLPAPELCCARLDGELIAVGDGWCAVDEPFGPAIRARAAALLVPSRAIAERATAAWIFGVVAEPTRHQFCVDPASRTHISPSVRIHLREVRCSESDTVSLGGFRVTTPLRTAVDLARDGTAEETAVVRMVAALLRYGRIDGEAVTRDLERQPRAPNTALALRRVRKAVGEAPVVQSF